MTDYEIDKVILSTVEPKWLKVAMVISRAAKKLYGGLPDGEEAYKRIASRIEYLLQSGRLEAQGDVNRWRYSEVRQAREDLGEHVAKLG